MPTRDAFHSSYLWPRNAPDSTVHLLTLNPLSDAAHVHPVLSSPEPSSVCVIWSGWIGPPSDSADTHPEPDYRAWSAPGRHQLDAFLFQTLPRFAAAHARLWIRPHARHILSDAPSCAAVLRAHEAAANAGTLALLLDLDLLITPDMAVRRDDHTMRIIAALAPLNALAAIALPSADWVGPIGRLAGALAPDALPLTAA